MTPYRRPGVPDCLPPPVPDVQHLLSVIPGHLGLQVRGARVVREQWSSWWTTGKHRQGMEEEGETGLQIPMIFSFTCNALFLGKRKDRGTEQTSGESVKWADEVMENKEKKDRRLKQQAEDVSHSLFALFLRLLDSPSLDFTQRMQQEIRE